MILKTVPTTALKTDRQVTSLTPKPDHRDGLHDDIRLRGIRVPLLVTEDLFVVDGYRRLDAAKKAGIETVCIYQIDAGADPDTDALTLNAYRRHLNPAQRAALGLKLEGLERTKARERQGRRHDLEHPGSCTPDVSTEKDCNRATARVANMVGISRKTYEKAKKVFNEGPIDLAQQMKAGQISIAGAYRKVKAQEIKRKGTEERTRLGVGCWRGPLAEVPAGRYRTIVCDPPWKFQREAVDGAADQHYPTMTIEALQTLDVGGLSHSDGCHLYLWIPGLKLIDADHVALLDAWGFTAKSILTWRKRNGDGSKDRMRMGRYFRGVTEFVLFCTKGNVPVIRNDVPNIFDAPAGAHSEKPDDFYRLVRKMSPGPHIELFSRRQRTGFDAWGDEAGSQD